MSTIKKKRGPPKGTAGRPPKTIDWETVKRLATHHCSGNQIACHLGIHRDTLYHAVEKEFGISYTEFSANHEEKGKLLLLDTQFRLAYDPKNPSEKMLIWLGKQKLKQRDVFPEENPQAAALVVNVNMSPFVKVDKQSTQLSDNGA